MPITNYEERYLKNYYATYQIALSMKRYINQILLKSYFLLKQNTPSQTTSKPWKRQTKPHIQVFS